MKTNLIISIIAILFIANLAFAQSAKELTFIRNDVNLINKNLKSYTKTTKDIEGISLEGTEASYFVSGRGLKKIIAKSYGETFKATTEFYFSGEELIFVFRKFSSYDTQIGMTPPPKVVSVKESRFYFTNGKMIKFLNGKKAIKNTTKFWLDSESETVQMADKLKTEY